YSRRASALRKMLAQMPLKGKNTFLITHKPNIIDALGKDWFDVKEGEASIFKPEDGKYRIVARVQMEDWPKLVAVKERDTRHHGRCFSVPIGLAQTYGPPLARLVARHEISRWCKIRQCFKAHGGCHPQNGKQG